MLDGSQFLQPVQDISRWIVKTPYETSKPILLNAQPYFHAMLFISREDGRKKL